jgi:hypothetical protein
VNEKVKLIFPFLTTFLTWMFQKQAMDIEEKLAMPPPGMIPQARRLPQPPNKNPTAKQFQPFASPVTDGMLIFFILLKYHCWGKFLLLLNLRKPQFNLQIPYGV